MSDVVAMRITGSVSKYGKEWQFRGRDQYGKQFRRVGFKTKGAAQDAMDLHLHQLRAVASPNEIVTVKEWGDTWLNIVKETLRPNTYFRYESTMRHYIYPMIGAVQLSNLSREMIREVYRSLAARGYTTKTLATIHQNLSACLRMAEREGKIPSSPTQFITPPRGAPARLVETWTFEELTRFIKIVRESKNPALWMLWVSTGLRRGEICGIRRDSVNFESQTIYIDWQRTICNGRIIENEPKTKSSIRAIYPDSEIFELLSDLPRADLCKRCEREHLFGNINPATLRHRLHVLADRAGIPKISPHKLRHTFGTRAAEAGMDIKELSRLMGHSRVEITMNLYVHPDSSQLRNAGQIMSRRMLGEAG